ncbi:ATP-binding cassette domain-containing protein [Rudaeicoccus suwonensis]|uniref:ABC transporter family protein n=1 Tax=Rudaeicoccus suwonensis TaxID=657409 RepID=A0A561EC48_9MICO|nr:ABC transporter family protein [Rudaeicoccus suwonensis]
MTPTTAIEIRGLTKSYGDQHVLDGVDLTVPAGTIYAILGSNGAGKTTTIRILATLLQADSGTARVAGHDIKDDPMRLRESISLTGQFAAVDKILTGRENLTRVADLRHLPDADELAQQMLTRLDPVDVG